MENDNDKPHWLGKKHHPRSIERLRQIQLAKYADSDHQQGEKNSQCGTCWVNKDFDNKKIKQEESKYYESIGWNVGRLVLTDMINAIFISKE